MRVARNSRFAPLPLRRWRTAVKAFDEAKTYENAVAVQREGRAIADWRKENIKEVTA